MLTAEDFRRRFRDYVPDGQERRWAVLVPLVKRQGEWCLLFEVRASGLARQPGEVCFPGGAVRPGETAEACALRETEEELGIPASAVSVISLLDAVEPTDGGRIRPVLAELAEGSETRMTLSPGEVREVFFVPLSALEEEPFRYPYTLGPDIGDDFPYARIGYPDGYRWHTRREEMLLYEYGGHPIWGLTARIVERLMALMRE